MGKERRTATAKDADPDVGADGSAGGTSGAPVARSDRSTRESKGRDVASRGRKTGETTGAGAASGVPRAGRSAAGLAASVGSAASDFDEQAAEIISLYRRVAEAVTKAEGLAEGVSGVAECFSSCAPLTAAYGVVGPDLESRSEAWFPAAREGLGPLRAALSQGRTVRQTTDTGSGDTKSSTGRRGTLIDRVLDSGLPVILETLEKEELPEAAAALDAGLRSAFAFPVFFGSEVVAVLALFAARPTGLPEPLLEAVHFALRQLELVAGSERADRAVRAAARHARAQAAELNDMAVQLRAGGVQGADGMYDALTGFPRRRLLLDRLQQTLRRRQRNPDRQFGVACLGIEGLREVRDRLGLRASEEYLLALCRRMQAAVRPGDTVARTAEDEFTIILEDSEGLEDANAAAQRVQEVLRRPYRLSDEDITAAVSIGLALSSPAYEYAETILRDATAALRASRAFGDEEPRVFDLADHPRSQGGRPHEEDVLQALADGEMILQYQPVVSLQSGLVAGFEARARWKHPERGLLAPEQFLPESGAGPASSALLAWSIREACAHVLEWRRARPAAPPHAAVSLTSEQFYSPDLVTVTWDILTGLDLDGRLLRFVVGEGVLARSPGQAAQVLASLGALEVGVVMDGFGTGYSVLPNLHRLRPRALVIDRAFLMGASRRPSQWLVARTIVELARILEAEAIASGVETEEQLARLFQLGCGHAQGPYFGGGLDSGQSLALAREGFAAEVRALHEPDRSGDPSASPFTRFLQARG